MKRIQFLLILTIAGFVMLHAQTASLSLPSHTRTDTGKMFQVPILLSSSAEIGLAQLVIDYNETVITFEQATVGANTQNFSLHLDSTLSFPPATAGTTTNVLVQLSGSGTETVTGVDQEVLVLEFTFNDIVAGSPIAFDPDAMHTFLTTTNLVDIKGDSLFFQDGIITDVKNPSAKDESGIWMGQCFPNPTQVRTAIALHIKRSTRCRLDIHALDGRYVDSVVDQVLGPGTHELFIDGAHLQPGVYWLVLTSRSERMTRRMIIAN